MTLLNPLARSVVAIAGLSYLIAIVLGDMQFDLGGNSVAARNYYCSFREMVFENPLRILPVSLVLIGTAAMLFLEAKSAFGSPQFLYELSIVSAVIFVELPLSAKCVQLQSAGCNSNLQSEEGPWPVHRNLLMLHMCILLTLVGSAVARTALLLHRSYPHSRISSRGSFSSKVSETSSIASRKKNHRRL